MGPLKPMRNNMTARARSNQEVEQDAEDLVVIGIDDGFPGRFARHADSNTQDPGQDFAPLLKANIWLSIVGYR